MYSILHFYQILEGMFGVKLMSFSECFFFTYNFKVIAVKHEYYELREIPPRLKRLQNLLEENQYSGPECEEDHEHQGSKVREKTLYPANTMNTKKSFWLQH